MSSTKNYNLRKIRDIDIIFGDHIKFMQNLINDNMDTIDSSIANSNITSISASHTTTPTDEFIIVKSGSPVITLDVSSISAGKVFYIGNNSSSSVSITAGTFSINGSTDTITLAGNYSMKTVIFATISTGFYAY